MMRQKCKNAWDLNKSSLKSKNQVSSLEKPAPLKRISRNDLFLKKYNNNICANNTCVYNLSEV